MEKSIKNFIPELYVSIDEHDGDRELVFQDFKSRYGFSEGHFTKLCQMYANYNNLVNPNDRTTPTEVKYDL